MLNLKEIGLTLKSSTMVLETINEELIKNSSFIDGFLRDKILSLATYSKGVCLVVGSVAIIGMMTDYDNKIGFKKYAIGSLLVYVGIKCLLIMFM